MTGFTNNEINRKSSVYNQKGENYYQRMTAYNLMRYHLRKILLAKSVVDTRNIYIKPEKKQAYKVQFSRHFSMDDIIDQMAYNTKHHPADVVRMNLRPVCGKSNRRNQLDLMDEDMDIQGLRLQSSPPQFEGSNRASRDRSLSKSRQSRSPSRKSRYKSRERSSQSRGKENHSRIPNSSFSPTRVCHCDGKPIYIACAAPMQSSIETPHIDSGTSSTSSIQETCPTMTLPTYNLEKQTEDPRYITFVYEITREIIKSGIYSDKDLNEVFNKHIRRNRHCLDMNKMLLEVYRLRTFLNVSESYDDIDEDTDLCYSEKTEQGEARAPSSPKASNEHKIMGKLLSYQKLMEDRCQQDPQDNSSPQISTSSELLVTRKDILSSLLEVGIDPHQAHQICENLSLKSKEPKEEKEVQPQECPQELETGKEISSSKKSMEEIKPCQQVLSDPTKSILDTEKVTTCNLKLKKEDKFCGTSSQSASESSEILGKETYQEISDKEEGLHVTNTQKKDEIVQINTQGAILQNDNYTDPMSNNFSLCKLCLMPQENCMNKIIQTEASIQTDVPMEIQIKEIMSTKAIFSDTNVEVSRVTQTELLAWSREKIAEIKASTTESPIDANYEYCIPLSKSAQLYLAESKKKTEKDAKNAKKAKSEGTSAKKKYSSKTPVCEQLKTSTSRTKRLQSKSAKRTNKYTLNSERCTTNTVKGKDAIKDRYKPRSKSKPKYKSSRTDMKIEPKVELKVDACTIKTCPEKKEEREEEEKAVNDTKERKSSLEITICDIRISRKNSKEELCTEVEKIPPVCTEYICDLCGAQMDSARKEKSRERKQRSDEIKEKLAEELETDMSETNGDEDHVHPTTDISSDDNDINVTERKK